MTDYPQANKTIHLSATPDQARTASTSPYAPRHMVITVSIPSTHVLHTASLKPTLLSAPSIAICGQPLQTTLRVSHTRHWTSPSALVSAANIISATDPIEFICTLEANQETWLVAGQRRMQFSAREDTVHEWPILLIPLKPGVALLPNVDIRSKPTSKLKDGGADKDTEALNCETDYLSYGQTVTVVPDVRSSTVGIGDMSKAGGSVVWLEGTGIEA